MPNTVKIKKIYCLFRNVLIFLCNGISASGLTSSLFSMRLFYNFKNCLHFARLLDPPLKTDLLFLLNNKLYEIDAEGFMHIALSLCLRLHANLNTNINLNWGPLLYVCLAEWIPVYDPLTSWNLFCGVGNTAFLNLIIWRHIWFRL